MYKHGGTYIMILGKFELNNQILEVMAIFISMLMIKKYVFLEPEMELNKRKIFYIMSIFSIIAAFILFGKDIATLVIFIMGVIDIFLSRKSKKIRGMLLIIPICGIINGIMVPTVVMPPFILGLTDFQSKYCEYIVYGIYVILLLLFYFKGKEWRKWFDENISGRYVHKWEKILLCIIGILMMVFSNFISGKIHFSKVVDLTDEKYQYIKTSAYISDILVYVITYGVTSFVLTATLIVLIMQGNKRSAYHEQVLNMQYNTIVTMADLVESRDENTGGHTKRTGAYVEIIANRLRKNNKFPEVLTKQYIQDMVVAAPLHDIGKIHIPDSILNKPGRLTDEEFAIMKTHAEVGRDLLKKIEGQMGASNYLNIAVDMAAYHHEWCNGKGYPSGLTGDEIPLCAKIMAVADVFDALTSKRCYKEPMPVEKAYEIIASESGTHFDEEVVNAFFESKDKIEEVLN